MSYATFLAALHPEDRAEVDETVRRVLADHAEYDSEFRTVWPDGRIHWIAVKGRAYYNAAGQPLRMEGVAMDITARTQAALALHESEERFRLVVESASNGIVMVDQDGRIVLVNREVERAFGYTREELLGATVELRNRSARPRRWKPWARWQVASRTISTTF